jgi:CYTH domain-containing protein
VTSKGLEIERKYRLLAGAPSAGVLGGLGARPVRVEQVYLVSTDDAPVRRVRLWQDGDLMKRRYTEKRLVRGIVREEHEIEVDAADYARLLAEADPTRRPIRKVRHIFPYRGRTLELDVFEDPVGLVVLEVELEHETDMPDVPPELGPYEDVSEDPRYLNWNLALR